MKYLILIILLLISISSKEITVNIGKKQPLEYVNKSTEDTKREKIIDIISEIESNQNPDTINVYENAVGLLQIRPIMIREVNQILKQNRFNLKDRRDPEKSKEIFTVYQNKFNPEWDIEKAARLWNGGRRGMKKKSTIKYWNKVKELI